MASDECRYLVALVYSTSLAIRAEKVCKKANIKVKLIPTPRHISSDCGIVLRFDQNDRDAVLRVFSDSGIDFDQIVPFSSG